MSLRRAIAEIEVEGLNVAAFCRDHGISRRWFYELRARFEAEGEAGLELRSRAPRRVANRTPVVVEDRVVELRKRLEEEGLDAGAATIRWHLERQAVDGVPSEATIWRILSRRGFITPDPSKRPVGSVLRFAAERANECWQIDTTSWVLSSGTVVKIVNVIDDCTRVCVASVAIPNAVTGVDAWETLLTGAATWGFPARVLSDNGAEFTAKVFVNNLNTLGIRCGNARPYHPQTCGKVERFHHTLKHHLSAHTIVTLDELQTVLDRFVERYNYQRPHRAIGRRTPGECFAATPKSAPDPVPITAPTTIHRNRVDRNGRIEIPGPASITIGAVHAGAIALTIRTGNNAHVFVNHQLVRHLTIDPTKRSQPLHPRPGRPTT